MQLRAHLIQQIEFNKATFGPGPRTKGILDHIKKEIVEVEESNGDASEWVDLVILALDGLTRQLKFSTPDERATDAVADAACNMIQAKQLLNELRDWPDWRTADPDKAIEHDRTGE